jgi:hypothetical protein
MFKEDADLFVGRSRSEPPRGGIKIRCLATSVLFLIPEIPHDRRQDRLKSVDLGEINDNEAGDAGRRRRKGWRR